MSKIDLFVEKSAEEQLTRTLNQLKKIDASILEISKNALKLNNGFSNIKSPKDYTAQSEKQSKIIDALNKKIERQQVIINKGAEKFKKAKEKEEKAAERALKKREQQVKRESDLRERLARQRVKEEKFSEAASKKEEARENRSFQAELRRAKRIANAIDKEQRSVERTQGAYAQLDLKLKGIHKEYRDLATQKEINNNLTATETSRMQKLESEMKVYDSALKKVDDRMGIHRRSVGNYKKGWDGLGNSINQITREMPAFVHSARVGFLALSNNIPILADEIQRLRVENKSLIAQGKPAQSMFKQIASSLFSWQTLLSVGVTLLTMYGAKLVDVISKMDTFSSSAKRAKKRQENLNKVLSEGIKNAKGELVDLEEILIGIKNFKFLDIDEQLAFAKKLKEAYSDLFEGIEPEDIAAGRVQDTIQAIRESLEAQSQIEAIKKRVTEIDEKNFETKLKEQKINEKIQKAEKTRQELIEKTEKQTAQERRSNQRRQGAISKSLSQYRKQIEGLTGPLTEYTKLEQERRDLIEAIPELQAFVIHQNEKEAESNKKLKESKLDLVDNLKSEFELRKLLLESRIRNNERLSNNEKINNKSRNEARERAFKDRKMLAAMIFNEEMRLLELESKERTQQIKKTTKEIIKEGGDKQKALANQEEALRRVREDYANKEVIAKKEQANSLMEIQNELEEHKEGIIDADLKSTKKEIDFLEMKKQKIKEINDFISNNTDGKRNLFWKGQLKIMEASLKQYEAISEKELRLLEIEEELSTITDKKKEDSIAYNELKKEQLKLEIEIEEANKKTAKESLKSAEAIERYLNKFSSDKLKDFGFESLEVFTTLEKNGKSVFANLLENAGTFMEGFSVVFLNISEMAQETMAFVEKVQKEQFDNEVKRLQQQKETALIFAGDTATAKEEIDKQYDERLKKLQNEQAEREKEFAIFNMIVDTAQGVVAALGQANYVLAGVIAALGAAQIAYVSSQEVPRFKDGVEDFIGGKAIVGDGGVSEIIETPDGKAYKTPNTDTLVDLPKHTNVFKNEKEYLLKKSIDTGNKENKVITISQMDGMIGKYFGKITTNTTNIDKNGLETYIYKGGQRQKIRNKRMTFKGYNV